jgi:hypothetical protein
MQLPMKDVAMPANARRLGLALLVAAVGSGLGSAAVCAAEKSNAALAEGLQGAWMEQSADCGDVFVTTGKQTRFREPVNMFAPALMIRGRDIITPGATCRILQTEPEGDKTRLSLSCTTSISSSPVTALFSQGDDGSIYRYSAVTGSGSRYVRCGP